MKKIAALLLVFVMLFALAACSEAEQTSNEPGFSAADLKISSGGKTYAVDVYIDEMTAAFGDGYDYSEALSCAYDGMDKIFSYADKSVDFYTRPDGEKDMVCEIYAYGGDWTSSKGIALGATRADVVAKYGEPTSSTNFVYYYEMAASNAESTGASLYFEFMNGDDSLTGFGVIAEQLAWEE